MPSISRSACGISANGLCIYAAGIAHYQNFALEMVLIPIILLGAVPFRLYYLIYTKRSFKEFLHDRVLRMMLGIFVVLAGLVAEQIICSSLPLVDAV